MSFAAQLAQFSQFSDTVALRANSRRAPLTRGSFYGLADDEEESSGFDWSSLGTQIKDAATGAAGLITAIRGGTPSTPSGARTPSSGSGTTTVHAGMSSSSMMMLGIAGVAVVAAFVLLGKKR